MFLWNLQCHLKQRAKPAYKKSQKDHWDDNNFRYKKKKTNNKDYKVWQKYYYYRQLAEAKTPTITCQGLLFFWKIKNVNESHKLRHWCQRVIESLSKNESWRTKEFNTHRLNNSRNNSFPLRPDGSSSLCCVVLCCGVVGCCDVPIRWCFMWISYRKRQLTFLGSE